MPDNNKIDTLDEALRIICLENSKEDDASVSSKNLTQILSYSAAVEMDSDKKDLMLQKLQTLLKSLSFGQLIAQAIQDSKIDEETAAAKIGLPIEVVRDLKNDS